MLGGRASERETGQDPRGAQLSAVLRQWKGVEPPADFEAAVWRRIRADQATEHGRWRFVESWREWLAPLPAWVNVAAASAGIVVGIGMGFISPAAPGGRRADEPLLSSQTLAGSYLATVSGEEQ